jgi:SulP family sulfate permease
MAAKAKVGPASMTHDGRALALARDAVAGLVAAIVLIANIVSFAALIFPGPLAVGAPTAIWAMLVGSGLCGMWIAWKTSLPPIATGIDSPTGAVFVLLSASASTAVLAAGGSTASAVQATLLMLSAATLLTGALLFALGRARRGAMLRFVPHFVVAGFVVATGYLLISGGVRMTTGSGLSAWPSAWSSAWPSAWSMQAAARLICALGVFAVLMALRRWVKSALAMPAALLSMTVTGIVSLRALGLSDAAHGWYLPSLGSLTAWSPLTELSAAPMPLSTALGFLPELLAVAFVALVSMVTKTAGLEIGRKTFGDFDRELRAHGLASMVVAPLGGFLGAMQLGTSRLLESAGGTTRLSGVACGLVLLLVGLAHFDLPALIPLPIAAGLVFLLGYSFLAEGLARPLAQRDGLSLLLTLTIALVCVRYGYLLGVLIGIVAACLLFALSYARTGVVRQHLSRAQFAGNVIRSAQASRRLSDHGDAIQIYWLNGYIFFGSSEAVFERVRRDLGAQPARARRHVVLDFGAVTGADASATISLAKLRNFCTKHGVSLALSSLAPPIRSALQREGFFAVEGQQPAFGDVSAALAWCEDQVLAAVAGDADGGGTSAEGGFDAWLQEQLGSDVAVGDFLRFMERRDVAGGTVLYRQGDAADEIDLVAAGRLVIDLVVSGGQTLRVRSITTHSVIGEMGFFRRVPRSATVLAEGPVTLFTLRRDQFDRMRREQPALAIAFDEFLLRSLSDRLILTDRMIAALSPG